MISNNKSVAPRLLTYCLLVLAFAACVRKTSNVTKFSEQTGRLRTVNSSELGAISDQHDTLVDLANEQLQTGRMTRLKFDDYKKKWQDGRKEFDEHAAEINAVLAQAVAYSEALVELVAAGRKGKEAGSSLLSSLNDFSSFLGGPILSGVTGAQKAVQSIADAYTQRQAIKSLQKAVETAQPAVDAISEVLTEVYSAEPEASIRNITEGLHAETLRVSLNKHGRNVINFCNMIEQFSDAYHLHALNIIRPLFPANWEKFCKETNDPENCQEQKKEDERRLFLATFWKRYCRDAKGNPDQECMNLLELQALQVVRGLGNDARPVCDAFRAEAAEINAWLAARRNNARVLRSALKTWAKEHARVGTALKEKRSVSTSELKAILDELKSFAGND